MGTHPIFESDFDCLTETVYMDQSREKKVTLNLEEEKIEENPNSKCKQRRGTGFVFDSPDEKNEVLVDQLNKISEISENNYENE